MDANASDRVVARYKSALEEANPLDSMRKQKAVRYLYKLIGNTPDGIFRDTYWKPVHEIFKIFRNHDIPYEIKRADYEWSRTIPRPKMPSSKVWRIEIPYVNERGREQIIHGTITAAGAGTLEDPLEKYDVTVVLG